MLLFQELRWEWPCLAFLTIYFRQAQGFLAPPLPRPHCQPHWSLSLAGLFKDAFHILPALQVVRRPQRLACSTLSLLDPVDQEGSPSLSGTLSLWTSNLPINSYILIQCAHFGLYAPGFSASKSQFPGSPPPTTSISSHLHMSKF